MEVLTYPGLKPIDWANPPSAATRVATDEICGDGTRFTGSMRTVCHMKHLMELSVRHFGFEFHIIQPPYNDGPFSAGTHDFDACADVYPPPGVSFPDFQRWLRRQGFDCWWRHTGTWASPSMWHCHGFPEPVGATFATKVGIFVPGQLVDYHNHALGLAGEHTPGEDTSWFPPNIHATAFNLSAYIRTQQENTMEYKDWSKESKQALAADVAAAVLAQDMNALPKGGDTDFEGVSVRQVFKTIYRNTLPKAAKK